MKKLTLFLLLIAIPSAMSAQFNVLSSGKAKLLRTQSSNYTYFGIGSSNDWYSSSGYKMSQHLSCPTTENGTYHYGLYSGAAGNNGSGRAVGVLGQAGFATNGYNYGVIGSLCDDNVNGAGIFGTLNHSTGVYINGRYAGYFDGDVHVTGNLTSPSLVSPSDIRLKENIVPLSSLTKAADETLTNLMGMNIIRYNYIDRQEEGGDTAQVRSMPTTNEKKQNHFGISAQELQQIYPDLVYEGQDGYLSVNYIELVPILIRGIQELKAEVNELRSGNAERSLSRGATTALTSTSANTGNILYQNTPNPFKEQTTIRFKLADDACDAAICIFDMTGKLIKKMPISSGETSVKVNSWELGEGMFLYTLLVSGKEIDTKRMIITK
jgi:hypothetical protein